MYMYGHIIMFKDTDMCICFQLKVNLKIGKMCVLNESAIEYIE